MASELELQKYFVTTRKFRPLCCQNLNDSVKVTDCPCLGADFQLQIQN